MKIEKLSCYSRCDAVVQLNFITCHVVQCNVLGALEELLF